MFKTTKFCLQFHDPLAKNNYVDLPLGPSAPSGPAGPVRGNELAGKHRKSKVRTALTLNVAFVTQNVFSYNGSDI